MVEAREPAPTEPAEDGEAELEDGITIRLQEARIETVEAVGPGETSGISVVAVVELENNSAEELDLGSAVVRLVDADDRAGDPGTGAPYAPLEGVVAPDGTARGTYVFRVSPGAEEDPFTLLVTHSADASTVLITAEAA
ncbi:protein of unknown function [Auraticoccus monumenti]|uniref:DUF4352 domain-containing protein n=1 Tax=Auraticoccus monumenti TaxID=675864 RepID=A0A1G6VSW9_9ACTN|nr:protein of unknown function [Auraticoccus monumenti]